MMRSKKLFALLSIFILSLSVTGCQLAKEEGLQSSIEDRIIGVFITKDYIDLFNMEEYLKDNHGKLSSKEFSVEGSDEYQGRIYATLKTKAHTDEESGEIFEDEEYEKFLSKIRKLLSNRELFIKTQKTYIQKLQNKK